MNDRKLLEFAAKSVYFEYECTSHTGYQQDDQHQVRALSGKLIDWNPLEDDGDALRLAVKLGFHISIFADAIGIGIPSRGYEETKWFDDPYAAVRKAITRAAAEIGKEMP